MVEFQNFKVREMRYRNWEGRVNSIFSKNKIALGSGIFVSVFVKPEILKFGDIESSLTCVKKCARACTDRKMQDMSNKMCRG